MMEILCYRISLQSHLPTLDTEAKIAYNTIRHSMPTKTKLQANTNDKEMLAEAIIEVEEKTSPVPLS